MAVGGLTTGQGKGNRITINRLNPLRQGTDTHKMKATHNKASEPDKVEWKFPCLGKSDGLIVLFTGHKAGMAMSSNPVHSIGEYHNDWCIEEFHPLPSTESVTLQND